MPWVRWAANTGPLARGRTALAKKAASVARAAVHIGAVCIVLDAALRLVVGRHDLVGFVGVVLFLCSAVAVGLVVRAHEARLALHAHVDEVALGLAALILEYFALAAITTQVL